MRVLLLGPYPPPHGGVQTNLVAIREMLRERRIPCSVINLTRYRKQEGDGIYYPKSAGGLLRLMLRLRPDILHLHIGGNVTPRLLGLGLVCAAVPGGKTVLTFHSGGYPSSPEGKAARPNTFRGFVFRRFDRIIAVNEEIAAMFEKFGVSKERLRLILPHAVIPPSPDTALTPELDRFFRAHSPVLLAVAGLEPEYDLPLQIDVLEGVRKRWPGAGLAIAGAGSLEDEIRGRIRSKPYAEHILLCGDLPHAVTLRAMAECDVMLRTTLYDGDSIAVREALHLGTPVIATDNGMRPDGVVLAPVSDPAALLEAIDRTLAAGRNGTGGAAPDRANIESVLKVYEELT